MKRKSSLAAQDTDTTRVNPEVLIRDLQEENAESRTKRAVDKLQLENADLRKQLATANSKLDQIDDVCDCDDPECAAEDHLESIQDILDGNGGGNGKGNGNGKGHGNGSNDG